jgi:hypothetical protein
MAYLDVKLSLTISSRFPSKFFFFQFGFMEACDRLFTLYGKHAVNLLQLNSELKQDTPSWQTRIVLQLTHDAKKNKDHATVCINTVRAGKLSAASSLWTEGLVPQRFHSVASVFAMETQFLNREAIQNFFSLMAWLIRPSGYLWGVCPDGQEVLRSWLNNQIAKNWGMPKDSNDIDLAPSTVEKCRLNLILDKHRPGFAGEPVPLVSADEAMSIRIPYGTRALIRGKEHVLFEWSHFLDAASRFGFRVLEGSRRNESFTQVFALQKQDGLVPWMFPEKKIAQEKKTAWNRMK